MQREVREKTCPSSEASAGGISPERSENCEAISLEVCSMRVRLPHSPARGPRRKRSAAEQEHDKINGDTVAIVV